MEKILTVSVAAYNMEKLITRCLDSMVKSEKLEEVEIIVTDDGSKDSTRDIVSEYAEKYPGSVKLIAQENHGPGSTVNSGIKNASGKYFRMVDSDDFVDTAAFSRFVEALEKTDADLIITPHTEVDANTGEKAEKTFSFPWGKELLFEECPPLYDVPMHSATFRTSLYRDNGIVISNGFYTDNQYLIMPMPFVGKVLFVNENVYMYSVSLAGQSMNYRSLQKNISQHKEVLFSVARLFEEKKDSVSAKKREYLLLSGKRLAGAHMAIMISFYPDKERKKDYFGFTDELRKISPDIYSELKKTPTAKVLSTRVLYGAFSKYYRRKNSIK